MSFFSPPRKFYQRLLHPSAPFSGECANILYFLIPSAPFAHCSSSFMLPRLVFCLPYLATFLSLILHFHAFSLWSQRDSPVCLPLQCFYFLQGINAAVVDLNCYCAFSFFAFFYSITVFLSQESPSPFHHPSSATYQPYFLYLNENMIY